MIENESEHSHSGMYVSFYYNNSIGIIMKLSIRNDINYSLHECFFLVNLDNKKRKRRNKKCQIRGKLRVFYFCIGMAL